MFDIDIISSDTIYLAGIEHQGDYMAIGRVFEQLYLLANTHQLLNEHTRSFGLYYDDPDTVATELLRSMACVTVDPSATPLLQGELKPVTIPAMPCARLEFKGDYAELKKPYDFLFDQWLPAHGREVGDFPMIEEYLNSPKDTPAEELLTVIYCPLRD